MIDSASCQVCLFYRPREDREARKSNYRWEEYGECFRSPPLVVILPDTEDRERTLADYSDDKLREIGALRQLRPEVEGRDFCGEFLEDENEARPWNRWDPDGNWKPDAFALKHGAKEDAVERKP